MYLGQWSYQLRCCQFHRKHPDFTAASASTLGTYGSSPKASACVAGEQTVVAAAIETIFKIDFTTIPIFVSPSGVDNDNNDPACQNSPMTTSQLRIAPKQNRVVLATAAPSLLPAHLHAETRPLQYRPSTAGNPDPS
jgi:hypothetical protein